MNGGGNLLGPTGKAWGGEKQTQQQEQQQQWKYPRGWMPDEKKDIRMFIVYSGNEQWLIYPEPNTPGGDLPAGGIMVCMGYIVRQKLDQEFGEQAKPQRVRELCVRGLPSVGLIAPLPEWWDKREKIIDYYAPTA